jgi:hypothetical protein
MLTAEKYTSAANAVEIFKKLRTASMAIMQSGQYSVRVRMLILCLFIQQVEEMFTGGKDTQVASFTDKFLEAADAGVYDSLAEQMPDGVDLDTNVVLDILADMESKNDERFNLYLKQAFSGLSITPGGSGLPDDFKEDYKKCYERSFAGREYIFENYIINHILMEGFPFSYKNENGSVMMNYADLLAKYNLIEFLLTGVCEYHKGFDELSVIDCVSSFARSYDHSLKGYLMMD